MSTIIVAPHADDEVLGTIYPLLHYENVRIIYCAALDGTREVERSHAIATINSIRSRNLLSTDVDWVDLSFPDTELSSYISKIADNLSSIINRMTSVSEIYIPFCSLHQDHEAVNRASLIATRKLRASVLEYSYPEMVNSYRDSKSNTYNILTHQDVMDQVTIMSTYESQINHYRNEEALESLAKPRGYEVNAKYAEGYKVLRHIMNK